MALIDTLRQGCHIVLDADRDTVYLVSHSYPNRKPETMRLENAPGRSLGEVDPVKFFGLLRAGKIRYNNCLWRYTLSNGAYQRIARVVELIAMCDALRPAHAELEPDHAWQDLCFTVTGNMDLRLATNYQLAELQVLLSREPGSINQAILEHCAAYDAHTAWYESLYPGILPADSRLKEALEASIPTDEVESMADAYQASQVRVRRLVQDETDVCVDGMEPRDRGTLALLVSSWQKAPAKGIYWRDPQGRTYLRNNVTIDLEHPFVQSQPWFEDLLQRVHDRKVPIRYE